MQYAICFICNMQYAYTICNDAYYAICKMYIMQASVKNFQLCHHSSPDLVLMQLGRIDNNIFNMDFRLMMILMTIAKEMVLMLMDMAVVMMVLMMIEMVLMQLGRIDTNIFNMDFRLMMVMVMVVVMV